MGGSVTVSVRTTAKRASNDPEVLNDKLNAGWSVGSFVLVPIVDRRLLSGVPSRRSLAMMPDHNGSLKIILRHVRRTWHLASGWVKEKGQSAKETTALDRTTPRNVLLGACSKKQTKTLPGFSPVFAK